MPIKENLLDNFFVHPTVGDKKGSVEEKDAQTSGENSIIKGSRSPNGEHKSVTTTFMINKSNIDYIEMRARTGFSSKSVYINWLIEEDMKNHPDEVKLAEALTILKNK